MSDTVYTSIHMCISVRGLLVGATDEELRETITSDGGKLLTALEAKSLLMDELVKGHEVLPLKGGPCDKWDWKEGCLGHKKFDCELCVAAGKPREDYRHPIEDRTEDYDIHGQNICQDCEDEAKNEKYLVEAEYYREIGTPC